MNATAAIPGLELWHVQFGGVVRTMTLDDLDHYFQSGVIDERTIVMKSGSPYWTTLAQAAGLDDQPHSLAPFAADVAPSHVALPLPAPLPNFDTSFGTEELAVFRPKRRAARTLGLMTVIALLAGGAFAITNYGLSNLQTRLAGVVKGGDSARSVAIAPPAAIAAPPPPVQETLPTAKTVSIDALPKAAPKPEAKTEKKKPEPAPAPKKRSRRGRAAGNGPAQEKTGDPTERGDGQFDPLNGKL